MLAQALEHHRGEHPLVLGVPRGGVEVAAVIAEHLDGELDVAIARKIGAPFNPELALGAVAADGEPLFEPELLRRLGVDEEYVREEAERQTEEVHRREQAYRGEPAEPAVEGRVVIVVDDGIATGSTMLALLRYLRRRGPRQLVCAVPVGPPDTIPRLAAEADEVVCPNQPAFFMAVGQWYMDFHQVSDEEVMALLAAAKAARSAEE